MNLQPQLGEEGAKRRQADLWSLLISQPSLIVELHVQWEIQPQKNWVESTKEEIYCQSLASTCMATDMRAYLQAHVHTPHSDMPSKHTKNCNLASYVKLI